MFLSNNVNRSRSTLAIALVVVMLPGCKTVVRELDMERARAVGAQFSTRAGTLCLITNKLASTGETGLVGAPGAALSVDCALGFLLTDIVGVKAEMGIYQDFQLQNGWKIERVDVLYDVKKPIVTQVSDMFPTLAAAEADNDSQGRHSFRWIHEPQVGSTRPTGLAALSTDAFDYMRAYVRIMIRGKEHTDPYVAMTLPNPETQVLSYARARAQGARFENRALTTHACPFLGQYDGATGWAEAIHPGVTFRVDCVTAYGAPSLTGGKADATAFGGFRLKNGWRIKDIHVTFPSELHVDYLEDPAKTFRWLRKPEIGSDDIDMKAHVSVNPGLMMVVNVKVLIEGPGGTDPYQ